MRALIAVLIALVALAALTPLATAVAYEDDGMVQPLFLEQGETLASLNVDAALDAQAAAAADAIFAEFEHEVQSEVAVQNAGETEVDMDGEAEAEVEVDTETDADAEVEVDQAAEVDAESEAAVEVDGDAGADAEIDLSGESFVETQQTQGENPTYVLPYPPVLPGHYSPLFNPYTNVNPLSTPFANYAAQPGAHPGVASAAAAQAGALAAINGQIAGAGGAMPYYPYAARHPVIAGQLAGNPVPFSGYAGWINPQNMNSANVGENESAEFPQFVEVATETTDVIGCNNCVYA
jgi:hypothetical protein